MTYGDPELTSTPCPACGCADVFTAVAPPGAREMPLYPACCQCGRERDSAAEVGRGSTTARAPRSPGKVACGPRCIPRLCWRTS